MCVAFDVNKNLYAYEAVFYNKIWNSKDSLWIPTWE